MNDILDVSDALIEWERPRLIKTVTKTSVDFVETEVITGRQQLCVIQVADKENVNPDTIDWSLEHILIHSRSQLKIDELVEYQGKDYIIKQLGSWTGYGYFEAIAPETKKHLTVVTP